MRLKRNFSLLAFRNFTKVLYGLFVGAWIAKYLGPAEFGTLSVALAIIAVTKQFSSLGLKPILLKIFVTENDYSPRILHVSLFLGFLSGIFALLVAYLMAIFTQADNTLLSAVVIIMGIQLPLTTIGPLQAYWESKVIYCLLYIPQYSQLS